MDMRRNDVIVTSFGMEKGKEIRAKDQRRGEEIESLGR